MTNCRYRRRRGGHEYRLAHRKKEKDAQVIVF